MDTRQFETRKREHIRHALDAAHQAAGQSGLDAVYLVHEALPDLNFDEIDLSNKTLGLQVRTPLYVAGMTAGHPDAWELNRKLAHACTSRGWCFGVGSLRREIETSDETFLDPWRKLRAELPDLVLFANLGLSQLVTSSFERIRKVAAVMQAQAIVVHANALQEALQPEGTPKFKGSLNSLRTLVREIDLPVVLKETGCGFSDATCKRLAGSKLAALDVSGLGGTHWGRIEGARADSDSIQAQASRTFANWGEPTVSSVLSGVEHLGKEMEIWASGGVRSGLDAARLLALGATQVGFAKPALEAVLRGEEALQRWMETQEFELRTALFCTGSPNLQTLREKEGIWKLRRD